MRRGLAAQLATGAVLIPNRFSLLLSGRRTGQQRRFEEGLAAVAEAIAIVEKTASASAKRNCID